MPAPVEARIVAMRREHAGWGRRCGSLYFAHQPGPLIVISAGATFAASYKYLDDQIE